ADDRAPRVFRPTRQRRGFGALHVGFVTGQPEQAGAGAGMSADGDSAALAPLSNFQESQAVIFHARSRRAERGEEAKRCFSHVSPQTAPRRKDRAAALSLTCSRKLPIFCVCRLASRMRPSKSARGCERLV